MARPWHRCFFCIELCLNVAISSVETCMAFLPDPLIFIHLVSRLLTLGRSGRIFLTYGKYATLALILLHSIALLYFLCFFFSYGFNAFDRCKLRYMNLISTRSWHVFLLFDQIHTTGNTFDPLDSLVKFCWLFDHWTKLLLFNDNVL